MTTQPRVPAKTDAVLQTLKQCAKDMRTITYGDLAKEASLAQPGVGVPLGYIRDEICRKHGLPWLNMIAVQTASRRPGESYLPSEVSLADDEAEAFWRGMVLQVYAYDWSNIHLAP